jgi:crotonobetainyl-CoA:carnitine CoA-transferase CaiB-like acyl-CoA transferase
LLQTFRDAPGVGRDINVLRTGFKLSGGDPAAMTPPPLLGADTDAVLSELGYGAAERVKLRAAGAL